MGVWARLKTGVHNRDARIRNGGGVLAGGGGGSERDNENTEVNTKNGLRRGVGRDRCASPWPHLP